MQLYAFWCSNRTFMELKLMLRAFSTMFHSLSSNRTFMELKLC